MQKKQTNTSYSPSQVEKDINRRASQYLHTMHESFGRNYDLEVNNSTHKQKILAKNPNMSRSDLVGKTTADAVCKVLPYMSESRTREFLSYAFNGVTSVESQQQDRPNYHNPSELKVGKPAWGLGKW